MKPSLLAVEPSDLVERMSDSFAHTTSEAGPSNPGAKGLPPLDLPPVEAPSAGFIIQLFVIPAIVVAVVIVVWLLFGKLAHGERDAMEYVRQLRSPSANWRLAHELASLINNDPKLANDPRLLGEMADLLAYELDHDDDPRLTEFVTHAVGTFEPSVGKLADGHDVSPLIPLARALGPKSKPPIRIAAAGSLAKIAARSHDQLEDAGAVSALTAAASDENSDLRQLAVYALGFFGGEPARQVLRDRVAADSDRFTRYNAAIALARRGDSAATATLREMLSTSLLNQALASVPDLESESARQNKIEAIELEALQALQSSTKLGKPEMARSLNAEIQALSTSGLVSVRNLAVAVLQDLQTKP